MSLRKTANEIFVMCYLLTNPLKKVKKDPEKARNSRSIDDLATNEINEQVKQPSQFIIPRERYQIVDTYDRKSYSYKTHNHKMPQRLYSRKILR